MSEDKLVEAGDRMADAISKYDDTQDEQMKMAWEMEMLNSRNAWQEARHDWLLGIKPKEGEHHTVEIVVRVREIEKKCKHEWPRLPSGVVCDGHCHKCGDWVSRCDYKSEPTDSDKLKELRDQLKAAERVTVRYNSRLVRATQCNEQLADENDRLKEQVENLITRYERLIKES